MVLLKKIVLIFIGLNFSHATDDIPLIEKSTPPQLIFSNELDNIIAPFTYSSSLILLSGVAATYIIYKKDFEKKEHRHTSFSDRERKWSSWGNIAGWGVLPVVYSAIMVTDHFTNSDPYSTSLKDTEYMLKTIAYTGLSTFVLKTITSQRRPKDKLKSDSFPSGHASSAFAFSTAIWLLHGPYWGTFSAALASWITYSRIDDGSHYYHDSIFGAALGISYALGIYYNHYEKRLPFLFAVVPSKNLDGLQGQIAFNF